MVSLQSSPVHPSFSPPSPREAAFSGAADGFRLVAAMPLQNPFVALTFSDQGFLPAVEV